jgi:hypothetical protein
MMLIWAWSSDVDALDQALMDEWHAGNCSGQARMPKGLLRALNECRCMVYSVESLLRTLCVAGCCCGVGSVSNSVRGGADSAASRVSAF